jgi:pimeloyl-ACP methyl ester carboxylesterase
MNLSFAHANSFPAASYRPLLALLEQQHNVVALPMFGHHWQYPVTNGWSNLVLEYVAFLESQTTPTHPLPRWLVGHSMGGFLSLMVAQIRPDLAQGVILLDAPIIGGWKAKVLQLSKATGLVWQVAPAKFSQIRREEFESTEQTFNHFRSKKVFARFSDAALHNYVQAGTVPSSTGVKLAFNRNTETQVYGGLPHHLVKVAKNLRAKQPDLPIGLIAGTESEEMRIVGLRYTRQFVPEHMIRQVPGGHLFPLEQPLETARTINLLLSAMDKGGAAI